MRAPTSSPRSTQRPRSSDTIAPGPGRGSRVLIVCVACGVVGCTDAASSDPGLSSILRVEGGQYRPGPLPAATEGPDGIQLLPRFSSVVIGDTRASARAVFAPDARAAAIAIDGVDGAWIVPAGVPDLDTPGMPVARFGFAITGEIEPGPFTLVATGVDAQGRFGSPVSAEIIAAEEAPPIGELVIGLTWSGPADLDLHVVDSLGGEAWADKPNSMIPPPPGTPIDPNSMEHLLHGQLDHDGNRGCTLHAHPSEHVIWQMSPQAGEYIVRVDTRSMCGAPSAVWYVDVYRPTVDGTELVGSARGTSTPADVLFGLDKLGLGRAGLGVTALRFSL